MFEYGKNYSKTTGSLWNYYRDEPNKGAVRDINYSITDSKYFYYKTNITGRSEGNNTKKEFEIAVASKYLSNIWRTLYIPLINCEINLILTWSENCVITSKATRDADSDADPAVTTVNNPTNALFETKGTNLYVPVVTEDSNKLLEQLKTGFGKQLDRINICQKCLNRPKLTI